MTFTCLVFSPDEIAVHGLLDTARGSKLLSLRHAGSESYRVWLDQQAYRLSQTAATYQIIDSCALVL